MANRLPGNVGRVQSSFFVGNPVVASSESQRPSHWYGRGLRSVVEKPLHPPALSPTGGLSGTSH